MKVLVIILIEEQESKYTVVSTFSILHFVFTILSFLIVDMIISSSSIIVVNFKALDNSVLNLGLILNHCPMVIFADLFPITSL